MKKAGMVNSVNEEGTKHETISPIIAGTPRDVVDLSTSLRNPGRMWGENAAL